MKALAQPPLPAAVRPRNWALLAAGATAASGAIVVLFLFDPAQYHIYPVCPLYQTTGLLCPGCGGLRAVHQLTHGHWAAAWQLNPFVVAMTPVVMWLGLRQLVWELTGRRLPGVVMRPFFLWLFVVTLVLFGILRNVHV